jgi:hypothetical protein
VWYSENHSEIAPVQEAVANAATATAAAAAAEISGRWLQNAFVPPFYPDFALPRCCSVVN